MRAEDKLQTTLTEPVGKKRSVRWIWTSVGQRSRAETPASSFFLFFGAGLDTQAVSAGRYSIVAAQLLHQSTFQKQRGIWSWFLIQWLGRWSNPKPASIRVDANRRAADLMFEPWLCFYCLDRFCVFSLCFVFPLSRVIEAQNVSLAQRTSCRAKRRRRRDFLLQIKGAKSNHITKIADKAENVKHAHSLLPSHLWTHTQLMTHDALGGERARLPSQLIMCRPPKQGERQHVSVRGEVCHAYLCVWAPSAAVRTSHKFRLCFLAAFSTCRWCRARWGSGGWSLETNTEQTNTQGYCLEGCLVDSAALDPSQPLNHTHLLSIEWPL